MYELRDADEGVCTKCSESLSLLTHRTLPDGYPAFLVCFRCRDVTQVDGDSGETVRYKRGRRKKFIKEHKTVPESAKKQRLRDHQANRRERKKGAK